MRTKLCESHMSDPELTREQQAMVEMWDRHTAAEVEPKDIDADRLPTTGAEASRKVLDPASEPSNLLIDRGGRAESQGKHAP